MEGADNHGGTTGLDRIVDTGEQAVGGQSSRAETCREWLHLCTCGHIHILQSLTSRGYRSEASVNVNVKHQEGRRGGVG